MAAKQASSLAVFFKLSAFHDHALRSLLRQKMLTIFKPNFRQAIMKEASQGKVGLFGGDQVVIEGSQSLGRRTALFVVPS